ATVLARHLRPKARRLILRIIELGEAIGQLAPGEEELETIGEERVRVIGAGERRDLRWIRVHERRVDQSVLGGLLEDLDLQLPGTVVRLHGYGEPLAELAQVPGIAQRQRVEIRIVLEDGLLHRDAPEGLGEVVLAALV